MPSASKKAAPKQGILHALLPGARVDKNTNKILVNVGTTNETIIFNVGGTMFETYKSTLRGIPNSLLANDAFIAKHFRPEKNDYFFDRDPEIFHCILNYLRSGELHLPTSVCGPVVKSELEFWGIEEMDIEECCWSRYSNWATTLRALRKLEEDRKANMQLNEYPPTENPSKTRNRCRNIWRFFAEPSSSIPAKIYGYISLSIIFISIFSFCAQTHAVFRVHENRRVLNETAVEHLKAAHPISAAANEAAADALALANPAYSGAERLSTVLPRVNNSSLESFEERYYYTVKRDAPHPVLYYMDVVCLVFFLLELTSRCLVAPHRLRFLVLPMTIIEVLALMPDIIDVLAKLFSRTYSEYEEIIGFLSFMRLLRVFRIFRLMRHIPGLWILFYTLKASIKDLLLLLLFVCVGMLIFSSLIYFAEFETQEDFSSIPKCFWWAVITMTTVGYGDMYPVTNWGYLIGTATGISGVLMIGFTVPVLVNNFVMYYQHTQSAKYRAQRRESHGSGSGSRLNLKNMAGGMGGFSGGFGERLMGIGSFNMRKESDDDVDSNANEKRGTGSKTLNGIGVYGEDDVNEETNEQATDDNDDDEAVRETSLL